MCGVSPSIRPRRRIRNFPRRNRKPRESPRAMCVFRSGSSISTTFLPISTGRSQPQAWLPRPPDPASGRGSEAPPRPAPIFDAIENGTMSIALPAELPARQILLAEGGDVVAHDGLSAWGRRPLRPCLVNRMPNKPVTETQIARLVGSSPIPVDLTLCLPDGYRSKSLPEPHRAFYRPWSDIRHEAFDGLIVTGAPIEALAFEEVDYWSGLCAILDWARARSIAGLYICWAAQAALYRYHGVCKRSLPQKMFGVYRQRVTGQDQRLLTGFGEEFPLPVSRHTEVSVGDLPVGAGLCVLAASTESGLCLVDKRTGP